jgi:hypothetical protein
MGGRKGYNPKNKGKKSYQHILTFLAETREYVWGELRNGDRPTSKQIHDHLRNVRAALPPSVKQVYGRADSGFYCREAVEAYEEIDARFVICARKTSRLHPQPMARVGRRHHEPALGHAQQIVFPDESLNTLAVDIPFTRFQLCGDAPASIAGPLQGDLLNFVP